MLAQNKRLAEHSAKRDLVQFAIATNIGWVYSQTNYIGKLQILTIIRMD